MKHFKMWSVLILLSLIAAKYVHADVLTSENTYGVETVESPRVQFYISPLVSLNGLMSNGSVESSSRAGFGVAAGVLLSQQILLEAAFRQNEMGLSLPIDSGATVRPVDPTGAFLYSKNSLDLGARLFIFERDARFRPYLAGGVIYSMSKLNYTVGMIRAMGPSAVAFDRDYSLNQFSGRGSIGLEVAVTSIFVVNAQFGIEGVLGYTSPKDSSTYDSTKLSVANSMSRATTYTLSAGLGVYL